MKFVMLLILICSFGCQPAANRKLKSADVVTAESQDTAVIPNEIAHCAWNIYGDGGYESANTALGNLTVCQSSVNSNQVYVQVQTPSENVQVCLFPTAEVDSTPVGIGVGKCLLLQNPNRIYRVELDISVQSLGAMSGVLLVRNDLQSLPHPYDQSSGFGPAAFEECSTEMKDHQDLSYCQAFKEHGTYFYKKL